MASPALVREQRSGYNPSGRVVARHRTGDRRMPSPFPGFDPFLEDQGYWRELHSAYLLWMQYTLADRLPDAYEVRIEERLSLAYVEDEAAYRDIQPDAAILRSRQRSRPSATP